MVLLLLFSTQIVEHGDRCPRVQDLLLLLNVQNQSLGKSHVLSLSFLPGCFRDLFEPGYEPAMLLAYLRQGRSQMVGYPASAISGATLPSLKSGNSPSAGNTSFAFAK